MKKTLFVVALATMLLFVVAGSAFAVVNHSGQQRLGAAAIAPANVANLAPLQTNPVAGAGTLTYLDWNYALGTNSAVASGATPHGNYTTTTVKCAVCHAVHYAAPGGAPVGSGQAADTLLRMRASDSCVYCHATANVAVNGRPVYNGLGAALIPDGATGGETTTGHKTLDNCSMCHTSVHGGDQDNSVASLAGYLLINLPNATGYATGPVAQPSNTPPGTNVTPARANSNTGNMIQAIQNVILSNHNQGFADDQVLNGSLSAYANTNSVTLREQAVGIFCAECHDGSYSQALAGAATNVVTSRNALYSGHRIATGNNLSDWNGATKVSSSSLGGITVAWAAAENCKSCHAAVDNFGNTAFPHAWGTYDGTSPATILASGAKMWLTTAPNAGVAATPLKPAGAAGNYNTVKTQLSDGVCLRCHVAPGGSAGVGKTF